MGKACQHCRLHCSHNFTGRGTNHRETKYAIVAVANKSFHKALPLIGRLRPKYRLHRQPCNAGEDTLAFRFAFAKPYASERGIGEHAIWNQPIAGAAISTCEVVTYDSKIVFRYVRELWTASAFPDGPHIWRACLQSAIDANVTAPVQFDAGLLQSNSGGIRNAASRDQDVASFNVLLTRGGTRAKRDIVSRSPANLEHLGPDKNLNTFASENAPHFLRDVDILASQELRTGFDDGHIAAEATISLRQFETGIAPTDHDQVLRQKIEL